LATTNRCGGSSLGGSSPAHLNRSVSTITVDGQSSTFWFFHLSDIPRAVDHRVPSRARHRLSIDRQTSRKLSKILQQQKRRFHTGALNDAKDFSNNYIEMLKKIAQNTTTAFENEPNKQTIEERYEAYNVVRRRQDRRRHHVLL
jgi:hypothetical protein